MNRSGLAALAALLLTSCGGPLLFAEVEISDLRVTLPRQSVPAFNATNPLNFCNPNAPQTDPPCVAPPVFGYDIGEQVPAFREKGVTAELRLTDLSFSLAATQTPGAPTDLSGIRSATLRVGADPAVPGSGTVIASYSRASGPPPTAITIGGNANIDLAPYVQSGRLPLRVEVVLDGGTAAFDADVAAGFYVRVKLDWGKYL